MVKLHLVRETPSMQLLLLLTSGYILKDCFVCSVIRVAAKGIQIIGKDNFIERLLLNGNVCVGIICIPEHRAPHSALEDLIA